MYIQQIWKNDASSGIVLLQRKDFKMLKLNPLTKKISKHFSLHSSRQKTLASMIFGAIAVATFTIKALLAMLIVLIQMLL